ncbi:CBS domain-containing protein [Oceanobacillus halotolerans]|uniref:CBS domain-containing protein n=1 Tax=Oceanobacillus halotolerans TaxID=2663380 RepID=UPI0013DAA267|nr:CBS domain-containing protein [Oceanobacillus halotolerans]
MYSNSEKFITTFTRIEKILKSLVYNRKDIGFARAVKLLSQVNGIVNRYCDDLLEFAALRNAIVHNKVDMAYAIAEPHDSVVEKIEEIERELTQPKKVIPLFKSDVYTFQAEDSLASLLEIVHKKAFSKFPIYDGKEFKGLITQKGVTNWMATHARHKQLPTETITLDDVLEHEEKDNYRFINRDTPVYEAVAYFREQVTEGNRFEALLITEDGNPSTQLEGIITAWDILEIP